MPSQYTEDAEDMLGRARQTADLLRQQPDKLALVLAYWINAANSQNKQLDLLETKLDKLEALIKNS